MNSFAISDSLLINEDIILAMDAALSKKLSILSGLLTILIVYIHGYNINYIEHSIQLKYLHYVELFISNGLARVAVPLFFFISGYLFFYKIGFFHTYLFTRNIKKRIRTILVPYVFWSILVLLIFVFLYYCSYTSGLFIRFRFDNLSTAKYLNYALLNPIPFQLWFLRDLFCLALLSPIIYLLNKFTRGLWLFLIVLNCVFNVLYIPGLVTSEVFKDGLLFFSLGGLISNIYNRTIKIKVKDWLTFALVICWLVTILYKIYLFENHAEVEWINAFSVASNTLGILTLWSIYDKVPSNYIDRVSKLSFLTFTFFIYVSHEPLLSLIKKLQARILPPVEVLYLFSYLFLPIFVILLCWGIGLILKKAVPSLFAFVTGGR